MSGPAPTLEQIKHMHDHWDEGEFNGLMECHLWWADFSWATRKDVRADYEFEKDE